MNLKIYAVIALVLPLVGCITGCTTDLQDKPQYKVFKYNEINHITSLDPAYARTINNIWLVNQIFDGLVTMDTSKQIAPSIAKSWRIDRDGTRYTFLLRDDVYWHNDTCFVGGTRKVTAQDVVYSLNRLLDPAVASPGSWVFADKVTDIDPFVALSDTVFVLHLKQPFVPMLSILTMQYCNIVPQEAVVAYGSDFAIRPVGSGPYRFKRWVQNQNLYLNKNPRYFDTLWPKIDGIKVSFAAEKKIAYLELKNGNLDYFTGLESSFINELLNKDGTLIESLANRLNFEKQPYLNFEYIGIRMDSDHPILKNKLGRQALNYAVDRLTMMTTLRNNIGIPADKGVIPRGLHEYETSDYIGYIFDPDKAVQLLHQIGIQPGDDVEPLVLYTNNDYLDICTFVANNWRKIGIPCKVELLETAVLRARQKDGSLDLFRASWIADYPDAESFLCMFYGDNPAPPNYTGYRNVAFDNLYLRSIQESDPTRRFALHHRMDSILIQEAPVVFLFYDEKATFYSKRSSGISDNGLNVLDLTKLQLEASPTR